MDNLPWMSLSASEMHLAEIRARRLARPSAAPLAADVIAGVVAGAVAGGLAGPFGAVLGAFVGGAMGLGTGVALETFQTIERAHDERLDRDIGVIGGDVGVGPGAATAARAFVRQWPSLAVDALLRALRAIPHGSASFELWLPATLTFNGQPILRAAGVEIIREAMEAKGFVSAVAMSAPEGTLCTYRRG